VAKHIDYLGGMPNATPLAVTLTEDAEKMLRADLENENSTIRAYRERVRQCETLGEYAIAEDIREILRQEQEHQTDLATALGEDVPDGVPSLLPAHPDSRSKAPVARHAVRRSALVDVAARSMGRACHDDLRPR